MIVWLASYPRSGNTLLRTVLKRCLDLDSYADEPIHVESRLRSDNALIGNLELPTPWPEFCARAKHSADRILVKTHLPPRDGAPFIYVVRDGRSAVKSYEKYYEHYLPGHPVNLFRLIAGDDAYRDWSTHYRLWNGRPGVTRLILRFEELTQVSDATLSRIADFLDHKGPVTPWRNPFEELAIVEPGHFREGREHFQRGASWAPLVDDYFNFFHAGLMDELGYAEHGARVMSPEQMALFEWSRDLVRRNHELTGVCDERLALIHSLHDEAQRRLEIINSLNSQHTR